MLQVVNFHIEFMKELVKFSNEIIFTTRGDDGA